MKFSEMYRKVHNLNFFIIIYPTGKLFGKKVNYTNMEYGRCVFFVAQCMLGSFQDSMHKIYVLSQNSWSLINIPILRVHRKFG